MPNAKRFLITEAKSEVIIFHSSDRMAVEGRCPICGADVTSRPTCEETKRSVTPPNSGDTGDETKKDKKEKEK